MFNRFIFWLKIKITSGIENQYLYTKVVFYIVDVMPNNHNITSKYYLYSTSSYYCIAVLVNSLHEYEMPQIKL